MGVKFDPNNKVTVQFEAGEALDARQPVTIAPDVNGVLKAYNATSSSLSQVFALTKEGAQEGENVSVEMIGLLDPDARPFDLSQIYDATRNALRIYEINSGATAPTTPTAPTSTIPSTTIDPAIDPNQMEVCVEGGMLENFEVQTDSETFLALLDN